MGTDDNREERLSLAIRIDIFTTSAKHVQHATSLISLRTREHRRRSSGY